jgi:hypothetical protein
MKRTPPDDVFRGPGLTIRRRGRFVEINTHRTPAQQKQLLAVVAQSRVKMRANIEQATQEFEKLLHKYTSFDLVGHLWLRHGIFDMDTYKEIESALRPHFVEHAAMLQLKDARYELTSELLVDPSDIALAEELLERIFQSTVAFYVTEKADHTRKIAATALDEFRFKTLLREMAVGPPAYPQHWKALLSGLFAPPQIAAKLEQTIGFHLKSTIACIEAVRDFMAEVLLERPAAAREQYDQMKSQLASYIKTQKFEGKPEDKEMFDNLRNMRQKERNHAMKSLAAAWITVALSDTISFTADSLSQKTGLSKDSTSRFLDIFSLPFGSTPSDYVLPSPTPAIRIRPIVKMDERHFCPVPSNLTWAVKAQFEDALKTRSDWESYQRHRAYYLVDEGVRAIAGKLAGCRSFQNLTYVAGGKRTELDGLILFDRYAFLIEGKAGTFTPAGRRGAQASMARSLQDLVVDPTEQAIRAWDYIRNTSPPIFETADGEQITINKSRTKDICPITLTLDSLDVFTSDLHRLRAAGVLPKGDLPWAVCLTDLWAISELISSPSEFTHFLRWRLAVHSAEGVSAGSDELNWFAIYLKEGPEFVQSQSAFDHIMYSSYTDDLDAFFYYQSGYRNTFAERPHQTFPSPFGAILLGLEESQLQDFTMATEFLLDFTFSARVQLAEQLARFASPKNNAASLIFGGRNGVVIFLRGSRSEKELAAQAAQHSSAQRKALVLAVEPTSWRVLGWALDSSSREAT